MSTHIAALKDDISEVVLMPGDPKRCEFIAEKYLTDVKQVNSIRNMNGYTGLYKGKKISLIPSGMGIPSIGIYAHELYTEYNVSTIIRVGTCGTYSKKLFDVILAAEANAISNFAYEYNQSRINKSYPTKELNDIIRITAREQGVDLITGTIFSADAFYKEDSSHEQQYDGVEMEAFALFHIATSLDKNAASLLTVSDVIGQQQEMSSADRERGLTKMIELALETAYKL